MIRLNRKDKNSIKGVDVMSNIDVNIVSHSKKLRNAGYSEQIDLYEQFKREQAESGEYRVIVTINSLCTNVLFNPLTEIATYDKSNNTWARWIHGINTNTRGGSDLEQKDKVQDTSDSIEDNVLYYCGFDIFDNHLLRSKTFTVVNNVKHNKIGGLMFDGRNTKPLTTPVRKNWDDIIKVNKPLYTVDDLYHFYDEENEVYESFEQNTFEDDGWFGFLNVSSLNSKIWDRTAFVPRKFANVINNRGNCEFNDLYPDRTLFTFTPVHNRFTGNDEDNWDVFITYPSEKTYDEKLTTVDIPSLPIVECEKRQNAFGNDVFVMRCLTRHNLKRNDSIRLFAREERSTTVGNFVRTESGYAEIGEVIVGGIGDENGESKDYCFIITSTDLFEELGRGQKTDIPYRFMRISEGIDCDYYIRVFRKYDARKETYPVAFAKDVYGGDIAQVTFTDGINVSGLTDHRGRPISDLFLTVVKKNVGADKWYPSEDSKVAGSKNGIDASEVEYSHCFGDVTMGYGGDVDLKEDSPHEAYRDLFHIRYVDDENAIERDVVRINPDTGEEETVKAKDVKYSDTLFYGDVVEYDKSTDTETVVCEIYHRFNTVQRDNCNGLPLVYNELVRDMYDPGNVQEVDAKTIILHNKKEGYYYNPHYRIPVRQFDEAQESSHFDIDIVEATPVVDYGMKISVRTLRSHGLTTGDRLRLYDDSVGFDRYMEFTVTSVVNRARFVMYPVRGEWKYVSGHEDEIDASDPNPIDISTVLSYNREHLFDESLSILMDDSTDLHGYDRSDLVEKLKMYRLNDSSLMEVLSDYDCYVMLYNKYNMRLCAVNHAIPSYAQRIGRNHYVWRDLYPNGDDRADRIGERVFTNGATYITENINFFLRRQDPDGISGLNDLNISGNEDIPNIAGSILPDSIYKYEEEDLEETC